MSQVSERSLGVLCGEEQKVEDETQLKEAVAPGGHCRGPDES